MENTTTIEELLVRGVGEVIGREHLASRLQAGEKLRVKLGIDPTSSNLHLGRSVPLLKLRDFQNLGHQIVFIIGDFTGVIGDTSDKESERPMLSPEAVSENLKTYIQQAGKILDMSKVEVRYNSEWLSDLGYREIGEQSDQFSLAEFIARENIKKRLDEGKRISLRELLYPLMQGYDSVAVKADVEVGGMDQRFNILAGRKLQEYYRQMPQDILLNNLILGTDGRKMSSSWGNTINLLDSPQDMFGKTMRIPDELIGIYFEHCTRVSLEEINRIKEGMLSSEIHPRDAKLRLARTLVGMYHGEREAEEAERYFVDTFSKKELPQDIREIMVKEGERFIDVLAENHLAESKGDARRKMEQGGVSLEGEKLAPETVISQGVHGKVLKIGKKDFVRLLVR